jgi:N-acyl-D-aspartate/D-glutamate deacylase
MRLRDPGVRADLFEADNVEWDQTQVVSAHMVRRWEQIFPLGIPPNYEPSPDDSLGAIAGREGRSPAEVAYDLMVSGDGSALFFVPLVNYVDGSLDGVAEMLIHPNSVIGIGDGGAHVGHICDASFPTTVLTHWGRDRPRGRLSVELLVNRQTKAPADAVGLHDRGVLEIGRRADINVIDFAALQLQQPFIQRGLPAGAGRFVQRAKGYRHTFVAGIETYRDGEPTGALPGRLLRSGVSGS